MSEINTNDFFNQLKRLKEDKLNKEIIKKDKFKEDEWWKDYKNNKRITVKKIDNKQSVDAGN